MKKHYWADAAKQREKSRYEQECFYHLTRYINDNSISIHELSEKIGIAEEKLTNFLNSKKISRFPFARIRDFLTNKNYILYTKPCKACGKCFKPIGNQLYCNAECKNNYKKNVQKR